MKSSQFFGLFLTLIMLFTCCIGCTTVRFNAPKPSEKYLEEYKTGTTSEIGGNYILTNWQESVEEGFIIDFEESATAQFLEIIPDAFSLKRYDLIAIIASSNEIKGFVPSLGIYEYKKNKDDFDMTTMSGTFDKGWREVFSVNMASEIRHMKTVRIPNTKAIEIFVGDRDGYLHKIAVADVTPFLDVDEFGVKQLEIQESINLLSIKNDRINAIFPSFSKNSVFVLLFSGSLLKVGFDNLEIDQAFYEVLWNGYDLFSIHSDEDIKLIAVGRHPKTPVIIFGWDELGEFKIIEKVSLKKYKTITFIGGKKHLFVNTDDAILLTNEEFKNVCVVEHDFGSRLFSIDLSSDNERMFVSTDNGAYILGTKIEDNELVLSSKLILVSDFLQSNPTIVNTTKTLGRFLNNTYLMIVKGNRVKLIRTMFDKQIEGSIEIIQGRDETIVQDIVPEYNKYTKYEDLLDKIELTGDWEAMKQVYITIMKDFTPSGSYFPGYAGTAMRSGWIEDTLADLMQERELTAALIILYWDEDEKSLLYGDDLQLKRKETQPLPRYIKVKQPLLTLHRALILHNSSIQDIVSKYIKYLRLWGESYINGKHDFKNLSVEKRTINELRELLLNMGFEIYDYLPAPMRQYHEQLVSALRNSEFLSHLPNVSSRIDEKIESFQSKWLSGS